ncbi:hypothetical protein SPV_2547 [Streptococcus pneumoniae]|nr:hypothetical protein SPV_2547 [Streptococcus pneumoniae]
MHSKKLETFA